MNARLQGLLLASCLLLCLLCAPDCWRVLREDLGQPVSGRGEPLFELARTPKVPLPGHPLEAHIARREEELASLSSTK